MIFTFFLKTMNTHISIIGYCWFNNLQEKSI